MSLQSIDIQGFNSGVNLQNKKPFLFVDDAFQNLENAYCWRQEVKKREGIKLIGRYRRKFESASIGVSAASVWHINTIYTAYGLTVEATAQLEPGSLIIVIGGAITFTDQGTGLLSSVTPGNSGYVNYLTGEVFLTTTAAALTASTASFNYFPTLPAMGIPTRELAGINDEETLWFDTKYCYKNVGGDFQEYQPGTTWNGSDSDFFWATNYRGVDASIRVFFVTNFALDPDKPLAGSPMRYSSNGAAWVTFEPVVDGVDPGATHLFTARILIPYYGRLLALNCWEGVDRSTSINIYNRCRFSQIGDPTDQVDGWRSDIFGRGGFVDAPINEEIVSATFFKNILIVQFERSTWKLQYLGEYGLPFIWERISSDFGSESQFSTILFDAGVLAVGDKAIVSSSGGSVDRIDADIPDKVYDFKNADNGVNRVHGIRDFKKEIVYWCYPDFPDFELPGQYFPNKSLLYNYKNNTYAIFRNNVTCFGYFQYQNDISWDRLDIFWDNMEVFWNSSIQTKMTMIVSGNQQGFAHFYGYPDAEANPDSQIDAMDQESLSVTGIAVVTVSAGDEIRLTIKNHNLKSNEIIYLTGMIFVVTDSPATAGSTTLNDTIYNVEVRDANTVAIFAWDIENKDWVFDFDYTNVGTYVGGGVIALFPRINIETKDFNPLRPQIGMNIKTNYFDFLFDASRPSPINIQIKMNTTLQAQGNLLVGNQNIETSNSKTGFITNATRANPCVITSDNHGLLTGNKIAPSQVGGMTQLNENQYTITFIDVNTFSLNTDSTAFTAYTSGGYWSQTLQQYYTLSAQYAWHRFYANCFGQYFSIIFSYSDEQMSRLSTHQQNFVLNAMRISYRPGGRNIFGK